MPSMTDAMRAYGAAAQERSVREQEADVFHRVNGALKAAQKADSITKAKSLADNRRLWLTVGDLMRDPDSHLPEPLRASIISVGLAVQREMALEAPDFAFLISVNENIAAGLVAAD